MQEPRRIDLVVDNNGRQLKTVDDAHLLSRVVLADRVAFESLYRRYFPKLGRFLHKMTQNPAHIEEIINDTMFVVWQKAATYNFTCAVSTWIFAIAYRTALKSLQGVTHSEDIDLESQVGDIGLEPEYGSIQKQRYEAVQDAMNALSIEHRSVVALVYFHSMSYEEVAQVMECPVNTVKTRMFHARRKLKAMLPPDLEQMQ